ncbi:MAG: cupin domain-containing protein [Caldisericia bacterium]
MDGIVKKFNEVEEEKVEMEGSKDAYIRWLIRGPNFALRYFRIKKGGYSPKHNHPYEHEVFVLNGKGRVVIDGVENDFEKNYFIYVPSDKQHQFKNIGEDDLEFLCIIPNIK